METKKIITIVVALVIGFGVGWYGFGSYGSKVPAKVSIKLPPEPAASDLSNCVVGHGIHYSTPDAIPEPGKGVAGPTFMYAPNSGEVVGIEYHITEKAFKDWKNPELYDQSKEPTWQFPVPFDLQGANYDHFVISWTGGHPGFLFPHIDLHVFTITPEERARICDGQAPQKLNPAHSNSATDVPPAR